MRNVQVVEDDFKWEGRFQKERDRLQDAFGSEWIAGHHIGSTAVPRLAAKPILDILIVVRDIERVDALVEKIEALGYQSWGEYGIPGRRYFNKGGDRRTHHLHVFAQGHPDIKRHLAFRDFLIHHPTEAEQYGELKKELAKRFPTDIGAYMDGKDGLIKELEKKALEWWGLMDNKSHYFSNR
ncbi:GrpB family protein [Marininema halotolerans]|uniref:GrpB domain, predicted nucleotidyltransferase, UPF0157 family n=1 Tax=Marininema halotolerans TaxID=1155944 RepID=A0A1I6RGR6_9BACL|nr:GrpB family protein [Marininema halotolerans]SFS63907.1 GrpB domain, predicted nucleotidyltransferase, UPF0157 family [Marininema halotolerans]